VPREMVEAADAFGSSKAQKLFKVQLPIAKTTIMAGINQTIMLALSMVVIAAMIGAKGLGGEVWRAIQRLEAGRGFEAGIGIVIIAIILDRVMQQVAGGKKQQM
jgi:glycine betaine/proline transport system permease protein